MEKFFSIALILALLICSLSACKNGEIKETTASNPNDEGWSAIYRP